MKQVLLVGALLASVLSGCLGSPDDLAPADVVPGEGGADDVVVIAVIDSGLNPYHWDMSAHLMPQHLNDDDSDDLPLDADPGTWLPGHPGAMGFDDYAALNLSLSPHSSDPKAGELYGKDGAEWSDVAHSTEDFVSYRWIPGSKVIGFVNFASNDDDDGFAAAAHGMGSASVSAGNIHGTCPECLVVFVHGPSEAANEWVLQQDWIDVQTNSWGFSTLIRDRLYTKSDTDLQREATERGQSVFFSAGNGQANTFTAPNPTLFSSQEGPDWIITVGAIDPADRASYSGHGKPADIANIGSGYPRSGGDNLTSEGTFGGTSNATPVTAGLYAKALYELRKHMAGASRTQTAGAISVGSLSCGEANPDCATADGVVTVHELRDALFRAAEHTGQGWKVPTLTSDVPDVPVPSSDEMVFMAQGHGAFVGRLDGVDAYHAEHQRITGFATGAWHDEMDPELLDWMAADSFCRQSLWGTWDHGYFQGELPEADPAGYPMRTWLTEECPRSGGQVKSATQLVESVRP